MSICDSVPEYKSLILEELLHNCAIELFSVISTDADWRPLNKRLCNNIYISREFM